MNNLYKNKVKQLITIATIVFILLLYIPHIYAVETITPSEVYTQALEIEKEVNILKKFLNVTDEISVNIVKTSLNPRHVWQKSYFILLKINIFRKKNGLPAITPNSLEPILYLDPGLVYGQTQRIITEIRILKTRLGILDSVSEPKIVHGKHPIDVFNKLNYISYQLNVLNHEEISPSYVFAEVMRVYEDITAILKVLHVEDTSFPPRKLKDITPKSSLYETFAIMVEIQRLQRMAGIERTDFSEFKKTDGILSSDVLNMVGMNLAELQTLKAFFGLTHAITPPAEYHENKTPADVYQLLRWSKKKLQLIHMLKIR